MLLCSDHPRGAHDLESCPCNLRFPSQQGASCPGGALFMTCCHARCGHLFCKTKGPYNHRVYGSSGLRWRRGGRSVLTHTHIYIYIPHICFYAFIHTYVYARRTCTYTHTLGPGESLLTEEAPQVNGRRIICCFWHIPKSAAEQAISSRNTTNLARHLLSEPFSQFSN